MTIRDYQEEQLFILIRAASKTHFGREHQFSDLQRYEDFIQHVPVSFYEDISSEIERLKQGASDLLWPGKINKYAVSAGTSGAGKHLPLSPQRLNSDRRFIRNIIWSYLLNRPNIFRLWGKHISLPGSLENREGFEIGEISAFTAQQVPKWLSRLQLLPAENLIHLPFSRKIEQTLRESIRSDIRVISAAPSWLLTIFQRVLGETGTSAISEIWPNLRLLICGGVKLANYRPHLEQLIGHGDVDFIETYGASEGYFSFTDELDSDDMKLVIDNGIFYEFIPDPLPDRNSLAIQETVPLWEVKPNRPYAALVTTNAGLWRYALNDIVTFTQIKPPRIKVMGRVSEMLDDYGEGLYAYEANEALREAASATGLPIGPFTVSALLEEGSVPRHLWFVQISDPVHQDTLDRLAGKIDALLREKNRHYAIRRESNALGSPEVHSIHQEQINQWLKEKGKHKAQGKLPSILRDEEDISFFK